MRKTLVYSVLVCTLHGSCADAASDKYNITPAEHQACDTDAASLCGMAQDEDHVLGCMRTQRARLTAACRSVFEAGLRKRHISL